MGIPIAPVVDLGMCVFFHICTVNNGYATQRMKLCADNVTVSPEQKCPAKATSQEQQSVAAPPQPAQPEPPGVDGDPPPHD